METKYDLLCLEGQFTTMEDYGRMSSSTSGSDARPWRRWITLFAATFLGLGGSLFVLLLLIDPYDTGRFPTLGIVGVSDNTPRTAHVSRARDPAFDSAVIGNSTGQLIDPHRLSAATGLRFTQLTIPATGPREQMAILDWFRTRREKIGAIVLTTDTSWCAQTLDLPLRYPFPFWLYGGDLDYLRHVLNSKSLDRAVWRVQLALGSRTRSDPVGYSDYTLGRNFIFVEAMPVPIEDLSNIVLPPRFPWLDRLTRVVAQLPANARMVLVMPPVFAQLMARAGSNEEQVVQACKAALAAAVAPRPGGFVDALVDDAVTRDPANFMDGVHYRSNLARTLEDRIIATLGPGVQAGHARLPDLAH